MMCRFDIGAVVRLVGGIAEYYVGLTGVVTAVRQNQAGLAHLNEYQIRFSNGREERFYEFQLHRSVEQPQDRPRPETRIVNG